MKILNLAVLALTVVLVGASSAQSSNPELQRLCRQAADRESALRETWAMKGIDFDTDDRTSVRRDRDAVAFMKKGCAQLTELTAQQKHVCDSLEYKLQDLRTKYTEDHPRIRLVKQQIADLQCLRSAQ